MYSASTAKRPTKNELNKQPRMTSTSSADEERLGRYTSAAVAAVVAGVVN